MLPITLRYARKLSFLNALKKAKKIKNDNLGPLDVEEN
jgi:hypothetical protein